MFFDFKKPMNLYRKKMVSTCFTVKVLAMAGLASSWMACSNTGHDNSSGAEKQLSIEDSIVIDASSIFKLYTTTITKMNSTEDSVLLLLDKIAAIAYRIDTHHNIYGSDTMPKALTADMLSFTIDKLKCYFLYEKGVIAFSAEPNAKRKKYAFDHTDVNSFHNFTSEFKMMNDGSFLICKYPNEDMATREAFTRYFNSKIVYKAVIDESRPYLITKDVQNISFPVDYRTNNYNDTYPILYTNGSDIRYTFKYWDSLGIITPQGKERYAIPRQFSVKTEPIPEGSLTSKTKSEEYSSTRNKNISLLEFKHKILLFQQIGAEQYVNEETGMLNDYLSRDKRMLVFDLATKQFDDVAYKLPPNCNPVKSYVFNNRLYLFTVNESREKIKIYITTLK